MGDRYVVRHLFARGGMAEVYFGYATGAGGFQKPVVIKRVHPHLAQDVRIAKMFTAEAKLASHLHHQNIVEVLDVGGGPEGLFLVMELVNGWDLGVLLDLARQKGLRFPPQLAVHVAAQALAGLIHAYKKREGGARLVVAHRDISPSNILISSEGEVKVADFGIARAELASGSTEPGTFKGKLAYAAPEQLRGEATDALSDQFSLGIVLYEMLAGVHPFGDANENIMAYVERLSRVHELPFSGIPSDLAKIVRTMLQADSKARFATPELCARACADYLSRAAAPASAAELQSFVESLSPPAPTLERAEPVARPDSDTMLRSPFALGTSELGGSSPAPQTVRDAPPMDYGMMLDAIDPDWTPRGPTLDASGNLHGNASHAAPTAADFAAQPVTALETAPLLLETREASPALVPAEFEPLAAPVYRDVPSGPGVAAKLGKVAMGVIFLGALAAGAAFMLPRLKGVSNALPTAATSTDLRTKPHAFVLEISSEPDGATISIDGTRVGTTPYAVENTFPPQDLEVIVTHRGYKPWRGTFRGGGDAFLEAKLSRR